MWAATSIVTTICYFYYIYRYAQESKIAWGRLTQAVNFDIFTFLYDDFQRLYFRRSE